MNINVTDETLALARTAIQNPLDAKDVTRAFTQPSSATDGLIAYDLEAPSKKLYPVLTPLRNRIARRADGYSIQSNWRAVTGINTGGLGIGVAEGKRGGVMDYTYADYFAKFVGCGLENSVTFEADYASKNFEDVKALAQLQLLQSTMIQEEFLDLGGMGTWGLGQTATPSLADVATGGTLDANTAYYVQCVALNLQGYQSLAGTNMGRTGQSLALSTGVLQTTQFTSADGDTITVNGGVAIPSANTATQTTAADGNNTHGIAATVTALSGAVAYAWYIGTSVATSRLAAVTTTNSVTLDALPAGTNQLYSALDGNDHSANSLVYDGMLTQLFKSGSGSTINTLAAGAKLTSNGAGGINEFDTVFANMWNLYRTGPDEVYVNLQQLLDINALVISGGGAPLYRFNLDGNNPGGSIDAGVVVGTLLNTATNTKVKVIVHPNMPNGTMMFWSNDVPYPTNNIGGIVLKHLRRDYYAIEWPLRTRKYEYGVYFDGVLKNYFPPAFAVINNISAGH